MYALTALSFALHLGAQPPAAPEQAEKVAVSYLDALAGEGDTAALEHLLGGVTLTAEDFSIPNWKIVERYPPRIEEAEIRSAVQQMKALDAAGRRTLDDVVNADGDGVGAVSVSQEQAQQMMAPTRVAAAALKEQYPVFAYVSRVGKDVFWHPSNPWRDVVKRLGAEGRYHLELYIFRIEEREPGRNPRVWPLRVLRIRAPGYDSGWKVLPASDWDPEF